MTTALLALLSDLWGPLGAIVMALLGGLIYGRRQRAAGRRAAETESRIKDHENAAKINRRVRAVPQSGGVLDPADTRGLRDRDRSV